MLKRDSCKQGNAAEGQMLTQLIVFCVLLARLQSLFLDSKSVKAALTLIRHLNYL